MSTSKRIVSGTVALAFLISTSMTAMPTPTQAATPIERFDAMGVTPMPDALAEAERGSNPLVLYYAAVYGVPATVALAAWAARWNPGASYWTAAKIVASFVKSLRN
jgi:hypothetical protein